MSYVPCGSTKTHDEHLWGSTVRVRCPGFDARSPVALEARSPRANEEWVHYVTATTISQEAADNIEGSIRTLAIDAVRNGCELDWTRVGIHTDRDETFKRDKVTVRVPIREEPEP